MAGQQKSNKAAKKARKRQKQKAKKREKQEAMKLERELDEWAQSTYNELLQECFLDQGISRDEAWDIVQQAKEKRREIIPELRALEEMKRVCEQAQLFEAACKEIQKTSHLHSPEAMATIQHFFDGEIVKGDGEELLYIPRVN